jgi:DNA-binding NarL/FixJ family response regulator
LRAGATLSDENIPVYVTASVCSREEVEQLLALRVQRVLIKPFKTRTLIDVLSEVAAVSAAGTGRVAATSDSDDSARAA